MRHVLGAKYPLLCWRAVNQQSIKIMRHDIFSCEWLSHDFIDNCRRLKPFPPKTANFDYKTRLLQTPNRWIWVFCSYVELCIVHLRGTNLQFSTIAVRMHFFMRICAYFGVRFVSIGVELVLGIKRTIKRNLLNPTNYRISTLIVPLHYL